MCRLTAAATCSKEASSRQGYRAPPVPSLRGRVDVQRKPTEAHADAHQAETSDLCHLRERHSRPDQPQKSHARSFRRQVSQQSFRYQSAPHIACDIHVLRVLQAIRMYALHVKIQAPVHSLQAHKEDSRTDSGKRSTPQNRYSDPFLPVHGDYLVRTFAVHQHQCKICLRAYSNRGRLKAHLLTHAGQTRALCSICGTSYRDKGALNRHLMVHTEER